MLFLKKLIEKLELIHSELIFQTKQTNKLEITVNLCKFKELYSNTKKFTQTKNNFFFTTKNQFSKEILEKDYENLIS